MEVCVDCVESAVNAAAGGACRLELCSALSEGGLTPTPGLLEIIKTHVSIPVFVMLRPRCGGDFIYSDAEVEVMKIDAKRLKDSGADGFVFGALTKCGKVDEKVCAQLLQIIAPLPATFHRAFDLVSDPNEALETIVRLGFTRILTSGQESSAEKGIPMIKTLVAKSENRIIIMPGAGITKSNLESILKIPGIKEFHGSARMPKRVDVKTHNTKCTMGSGEDFVLMVTSSELVQEMVGIARNIVKEQ
ncbi:copper homeostasis protein cutC homolog isoform X2 [Anabrus simplex]